MTDRGPFLQTFSGRHFFPFDPRPDEVCLEDVAHALSHEGRWGGHTEVFYSVAQHTLDVAVRLKAYGPRAQFAGLHHDDSEAYLRDIPRPIKHHPSMEPYRAAERRVQGVLDVAFGVVLTDEILALVHFADEEALAWEAHTLLKGGPQGWSPEHGDAPARLGAGLLGRKPAYVKDMYLGLHHRLVAEIAAL